MLLWTVWRQQFLSLPRTFSIHRMLNKWPKREQCSRSPNGLQFLFPPSKIESLSTKFVPKKTADSTKWAVCIFTDWVQERNRCPSALTDCPADLFDYTKVTSGHNGREYGYPLSLLDFWLAAFVTEVPKLMEASTLPDH